MKKYSKPQLNVINMVQADEIANPWGSFAGGLDELGGAITSYEYGSGVELSNIG